MLLCIRVYVLKRLVYVFSCISKMLMFFVYVSPSRNIISCVKYLYSRAKRSVTFLIFVKIGTKGRFEHPKFNDHIRLNF